MKIASWNLARGLSDANRAGVAIEHLDRLDADLVFLPEAYDESGEPIDPDFAEKLGYEAIITEYEDTDPHPSNKQYIVGLSRIDALVEVLRLESRNALIARFALEGSDVAVVGAHYDDRSEQKRLGMTSSFLSQTENETARVLIGDLNSMHGEDFKAKVLSSESARQLASRLKNDRMRSLATRLTDMATGNVLSTLEAAGMHESDSAHRPTMLMGRLAIVELDHFLHDESLIVSDFQLDSIMGFDHRSISGQLGIR